jgi:hypothetical protein
VEEVGVSMGEALGVGGHSAPGGEARGGGGKGAGGRGDGRGR